MVRRLIISAEAISDLDNIGEYTAAEWSPAQAIAYLEGIDRLMELLCRQPEMGRLRPEFRRPVRMHPYRSHTLFYRSDERSVTIVRILHARSDWQDLLPE